jgi:hypothetical protein
LLARPSAWTYGDLFRLNRLQSSYPAEAIYDPALNTLFLALDVITPGTAELFWNECKRCKPRHDPGFSDFWRWREVADRPADPKQALLFSQGLVREQVTRVSELLSVHDEIAGDEAAELADRASGDGSAAADRIRRTQTARGRELRQTIELLMKMQEVEDKGHEADGIQAKDRENGETSSETPAPTPVSAVAIAAPGQRMAVQAFEKLFDDPPAKLAAVIGSPELAELKLVSGGAPVRASGATEGAKSARGMKTARIEANRDETQVDGRQDDVTDGNGAGGGERTQVRERRSLGHGETLK